jgi:hypothetical protein
MANHRAQPRHRTPRQWLNDHRRDTAPPGIAYAALALGLFTAATCWMARPVVDWTLPAGVVGVAIGLVGIWTSRQILSGVAVVVAGVGVVLTLMLGFDVERGWRGGPPPVEQSVGHVVSGLPLGACGR